MQRTVAEKLITWKDSSKRKPLIVQGARQVGKTWAIQDFGTAHFDEVAHIDFLEDEEMKQVFEGDLAPKRLLDAISIQTGTAAGRPEVLIFLDEIQEAPRALTSLKIFAERNPEVPLIAAGSLLGVALHQGNSFPVGKVDHLEMFPMTFYEYLLAANPALSGPIEQRDYDMLSSFSEKYVEELKRYLFIGGMPEVVQTFLETGSYDEVRRAQERLLYDYEHDFSKHASAQLAEKIRMIWASAPAQLGRENKKFVYSAVKKGARARGYEEAIQWLVDARLVLKVERTKKPGLPLAAYADREAFKLYLLDVGLLGAASRLSTQTLLEGDALFTEFKGSLAENFVCQQLVATGELNLYYWSAESSNAEVDFIYDFEGKVVPVEVKARTNLRSKSLKSFLARYDLPQGLRLSLAGFDEQSWVVNLPLYAANALPTWRPPA